MGVINRTCPKCGDDKGRVTYDAVFEAMRLRCNLCGYEWQRKPLDVLLLDDKERPLAAHYLCRHHMVEVDAYPYRESKCTKCGVIMTIK